MNYEEFKERFIEEVKEKLAEQGYDMNVSVNEVKKLNETYEAMTVTPEGARIGMNVNLEKFYEAYDEGRPLGEVVDKALETIDHAINERPDSMMARQEMKEYQTAKYNIDRFLEREAVDQERDHQKDRKREEPVL